MSLTIKTAFDALPWIHAMRKAHREVPEGLLQAEWLAVDTFKDANERPLIRIWRNWFKRQEEEALRRLRREMKSGAPESLHFQIMASDALKSALLASHIFPMGRYIEETAAEVFPEYRRIADAGIRFGLRRISVDRVDITSNDPSVLPVLNEILSRTQGVHATTADSLTKTLQEGLSAGEGFAELSDRVQAVFQSARRSRAETIARTAAVGAFERGQLSAWQRAGVPSKAWLSQRDGLVRTEPFDHLGADGETVPVDKPFTRTGQALQHPGDTSGSAGNVIRCRCTSRPVMQQAESPTGTGPSPERERPRPELTPSEEETGFEPSGTPVSDHIGYPSRGFSKETAEYVLPKIDKVHGDGPLPDIQIKSGLRDALGEYRSYYSTRDASMRPDEKGAIKLNTQGPRPELTLAHEIGHFLDQQGLGKAIDLTGSQALRAGGGFWSRSMDPKAAQWRERVKESTSYKRMNAIRENGYIDPDFGAQFSPGFIDYLLSWEEIFARSYAQYIATRSVAPRMILAVNDELEGGYGFKQWTDEDFEPIALMFDEIFKEQGWLK